MTLYVDWMHPSVRDLVIEKLREHDADRVAFLSTAGPDAIILAISTGGGPTGERSLPLIVTDGDWAALESRISELPAEALPSVQLALLRALSAALTAASGRPTVAIHRLAILGARLLLALREAWDFAAGPVATEAIGAYYALPVQPSDEEFDEKRWMELAQRVTALLADIRPDFARQLAVLSEKAESHEEVRGQREDRYAAWQQPDREDYGEDERRPGPDFDIEDFFRDL